MENDLLLSIKPNYGYKSFLIKFLCCIAIICAPFFFFDWWLAVGIVFICCFVWVCSVVLLVNVANNAVYRIYNDRIEYSFLKKEKTLKFSDIKEISLENNRIQSFFGLTAIKCLSKIDNEVFSADSYIFNGILFHFIENPVEIYNKLKELHQNSTNE